MNKHSRIIAVVNEKGGVGKTVSVINLGAALTLERKKVLIIDIDPQSNATKGLGVRVDEETITTYDLIKESGVVPCAAAITPTQWRGLDLIPADVDLCGAEVELTNELGRENRLSANRLFFIEKVAMGLQIIAIWQKNCLPADRLNCNSERIPPP